jgi:nucleotidyltransferase substrate binding protein (TIGR01987 family)
MTNIRWKQRFNNYQSALSSLEEGILLAKSRPLSDLEKQGIIQGFKVAHELFWKTVKDFLEFTGNIKIFGSKDATKEAFSQGLISNGDNWMKMIESRNLTSHTYNKAIANDIVSNTIEIYYELFKQFESKMTELLK